MHTDDMTRYCTRHCTVRKAPCRTEYPVAQVPTPPSLCVSLICWSSRPSALPTHWLLLAPGRAPLTYGRLRQHIDDVVQTLHAMGVGRHDRVALVLPNGPEMAVAFLAVACWCHVRTAQSRL